MQGEGGVDDRKTGGSGFLPDAALERLGEDRLTHRVYVDALKEIVQTCHTPFTIGVTGRWGTGKTSIGNMLLREIRADASLRECFKTMLFDVWKYPGDSLRRKFLLEVADCLASEEALKDREDLWEALYTSRSQDKERTWRFDAEATRWWLPIVAIYVAVAAALVFWVRLAFASQAAFATGASILIGVVWTLLALLRGFFAESRWASSSKVSLPPLHSPEQFEDRFEAMLQAGGVSSKPGASRLVVVVDNLDRCSSEGAVEALRTIKTFLEKDGCVFIITCDDEALKQHLDRVYKWESGKGEAEEYLRKFFNTAIRIKVARQDSVQLAETLASDIGFPHGIAEVLWAAEPESPRRVKEFLNRLRALDIVLSHEERSGRVSATVRDNLPFLAKIMVLEERWPDFVSQMRRDDDLLDRARQVLRNASLLEDDGNSDLRLFLGDHPADGYTELKEFLIATSSVRDDDVRPFLALRQDTHELMVDQAAQLRQALRRGLEERVRALLAAVEGDELLASWQLIHQVINEERVAGRVQFGTAALAVGVQIFSGCPDALRSVIADAIALLACTYGSAIAEVPPSKLMAVLKHATLDWAREGVGDQLIGAFSGVSPHRQDFLRGLRDHHELFTGQQLQRIAGFLSDQLEEDWDKAVGLVQEIGRDHDGVGRLVRSEPRLLSVIVRQIHPSDVDKARSAATLFLQFTDAAQEAAWAELSDCVGKLLVHPSSPPMGPEREVALFILDRIDVSHIPDAKIDSLLATLRRAFDEIGSTEGKRRLLGHALRIRDRASDDERSVLDSKVEEAVLRWPPDQVRALVEPQLAGATTKMSAMCRGALGSRIREMTGPREDIVKFLQTYVALLPIDEGGAELSELLGSLVASAHTDVVETAAECVQQHFTIFDREQRLSLLKQVRDRANALAVGEKQVLLYPLVELAKMKDPRSLRIGIGNDLVDLIKSADVRGVNVGVRLYRRYASRLSLDDRSSLARELIRHIDANLHRLDLQYGPLVQLAIHEAQKPNVRRNTRTQLVDLLIDLWQPSRSEDQRILGLRGVAEWNSFPRGVLPGLTDRIDTVIDDPSSSKVLRHAAVEARDHVYRVASPTRPLGKPSGIGVWATYESGDIGQFSDAREGPWKSPALCEPVYPGWPSLGSAKWVWIKERPSDAEARDGQVVWHRLDLHVERPTLGLFNATLLLRVDDEVKLLVNGQPAGSATGFGRITEVDLTPYVRQGDNHVQMEITNHPGTPDRTGLTNPSGIIYRLEVA